MNKIKNKAEGYSILGMVENMQVFGLMVNNVVLVYIIKMKINIKQENGIMDKEQNGLRMKKQKVIKIKLLSFYNYEIFITIFNIFIIL